MAAPPHPDKPKIKAAMRRLWWNPIDPKNKVGKLPSRESMKELFEKSVEGEAYDLEQYGQYFRPAGMAYQGKPQVAVPTASAPAATPPRHLPPA